jgi:cell division protein FtsQ
MPALDKFSSRVVLISGAFSRMLIKKENVTTHELGLELMDMLELIREDDFWKAQIAQLDIDGNGRVVVYPQVGGEVIEFGRLGNSEEKLKKLRVYYKEILPQKGWNKYSKVNLEFEGQIVAE